MTKEVTLENAWPIVIEQLEEKGMKCTHKTILDHTFTTVTIPQKWIDDAKDEPNTAFILPAGLKRQTLCAVRHKVSDDGKIRTILDVTYQPKSGQSPMPASIGGAVVQEFLR